MDPSTPDVSAVLPPDTINRLMARFPDAPAPVHRETPEEAAERVARAAKVRASSWHVDPKYVDADLDGLTAAQDPNGLIRRWWTDGGCNLIIRGEKNGTGKSHAAHAIGNHAVSMGLWGATWTMSRLNAAMRPGGDESAYDVAAMCDLLVLDEVGAEQITEWTLERLGDILDARSRVRRTIITTNLTGDKILARYDGRIVSRMLDDAWVVEFTGDTWRQVRKAPW